MGLSSAFSSSIWFLPWCSLNACTLPGPKLLSRLFLVVAQLLMEGQTKAETSNLNKYEYEKFRELSQLACQQ